jgi:hypothetical protein
MKEAKSASRWLLLLLPLLLLLLLLLLPGPNSAMRPSTKDDKSRLALQ